MATDNAGVGLFEVTGRGRTVWWSARMHALHGTDAARFIPSVESWSQLIHPADRPRVRREAMQALAGRRMFDTEYRIVGHDGVVRTIRAFARRRDGDQPTLIGTNWDITAEREAVGRLRLANAHIEQFATVVSHDLQAPLRQIALWADILRRDAADRLEKADLEIVERIQRRARQMRRMIVGLLEFSRAGADIDLVPVDLVRVATEAVSDYAAELGAIGGSVVVEPIPRALGDPLMVGQIFGNLISNAIKYRGTEPLQIVLNGWEEPGFIVVSVRDNGLGIDPVYADAVFELFRRLPEAAGRDGSGVGLAVCQRMAAAMGGSISLDTSVCGGSMFVLRLRPVHGVQRMGSADAARSPVS
jgi:PAS domain S-box-containing protein